MENDLNDKLGDSCPNLDRANSTFQKHINSVRRKWLKDQENVILLKYEVSQLHNLCDKLLADGRLTLDELRGSVMSRKEAKKLLFKK